MYIREAVDLWLLALETEGRRPATLAAYRWHWTPFLRWLDSQDMRALDALTPFIIRRWLSEYQKTHAPASLKSMYAGIGAFVHWADREGLLSGDPLKNMHPPRVTTPPKTALTDGQVRALLSALQADKSPTGLRNLALVAFCLDTGARASEVCAIGLSDVTGDTIVLKRTKNGRPRPVFLGKRSSQAMHRYLAYGRTRLHPQSDRLFLALDGQPLTRNAIHNVLKRLSAHLGFHVHAHLLRHTWATTMARAGVNAPALMVLAGWSDIDMAQVYVHMTAEDLRRVHAEAQPLDGIASM